MMHTIRGGLRALPDKDKKEQTPSRDSKSPNSWTTSRHIAFFHTGPSFRLKLKRAVAHSHAVPQVRSADWEQHEQARQALFI